MSKLKEAKFTMSIPELAKALGISKNLCYELAGRNELPVPVIRLGNKRMVVSKKAFEEVLALATTSEAHEV